MPKLFNVDMVVSHGESASCVVVANTVEEAEQNARDKDYGYIYSAYASEITEIDGYKVVFKKGKKIVLEKQS